MVADWIFVSGSAMVGTSIGLNAISTHGACTAAFVAIAAAVGFIFSSVRALGNITWIAWFGLSSVMVSGELEAPWPQSKYCLLSHTD
jgi:hypothetical protein